VRKSSIRSATKDVETPKTVRKTSTRQSTKPPQSTSKARRRSSYVDKAPKKDTVKYLKGLLCNAVEEKFIKLYDLWNSLELNGKTKRERTKNIKEHFEDYLDGMVEEEFELKNQLLDSLETNIKRASKLRKELGVSYEEIDSSLTLMQYEEAVKDEVKRMVEIREDRIREARELMEKEGRLCETLSKTPLDESVNSVPSTDQLEEMRERVSGLEDEVERINLMNEMRKEIKLLWENCFYSKDQRNSFKAFHSKELTEELFALHKDELEKLECYFASNKQMLNKLAKWQEVWKQAVELERKRNDPTRLTNIRENVLLQQEREKKKVMKVLPRIELELANLIYDWEEKQGETFLVEGVSFAKFLEQQREGQDALLAMEKQVRDEAKKKKPSAVSGARTRSRDRVSPSDSSYNKSFQSPVRSRISSPVGSRIASKVAEKKKDLTSMNRRSFAIKKNARPKAGAVRATPARAAKTKATGAQAKGLRNVLLMGSITGGGLGSITEDKLNIVKKGSLFSSKTGKKKDKRKDSICRAFSSIKL